MTKLVPHQCGRRRWCGLCVHNTRHGGTPNHPGNLKRPPAARPAAILSLPCVHLGRELSAAERQSRKLDSRRWAFCNHPAKPLGEAVCGCKGCGKGCRGYSASLSIHHGARSIGDEVVSLYVACGLADESDRAVVLHARHAPWLAGLEHPGVTIRRGDGTGADCQIDFKGEVRESRRGVNRAAWYCRKVAEQLKVPEFTATRPMIVSKPARILAGPYTLLVPFANGADRDWPGERWRQLAVALLGQGRRVEATAASWGGQPEKIKAMFAGMKVGLHIAWQAAHVVSLIAHAEAVIGNDSGMAHIAGLHRVPTVVVQSGWPVGHVHSLAPTVREVRPVGAEGLAGVPVDRVLAVFAEDEFNRTLHVRQEGLVGAGEGG